jgi:hypothetical protein
MLANKLRTIRTIALTSAFFAISSINYAQVPYDDIEIGSVLDKTGISLGAFSKPIPLPQGVWQVKGKRVDQLQLSGGRSDSPTSTPRVALWLKNTESSTSQIAGIVMTFTPNSIPINWRNNKCENADAKRIVDDFGFDANGMLYACADGGNWSKFRGSLAAAPESKNEWIKANLTAFTPDANDFPDDTIQFSVSGNKFRGKQFSFRFILKREGDSATDLAYRDYLKAWAHGVGLNLTKLLNNELAVFETPTGYVASK